MRIKLFGERNTGTQLMRELLRANGYTDLWPGTIAELGEGDRVAAADRPDLPERDRAMLREAFIDDLFAAAFERTLGWKHGAADGARLRAASADTTVIVTVKNPYAWVVSMYRRPHHNLLAGNVASLETFVASPWLTCGRDNVGRRVESIVDLWLLKYRAWLVIAGILPSVVVRYEDLMREGDATLPLRRALGADQKAPWTMPSHVPNNAGDFAAYRSFYAEERWRAALSPAAIAMITARLDRDLVERLGYALIA